VRRRKVLQVSVGEVTEQEFGDEGEGSLVAKDVQTEQRVNHDVSRNDPFIRLVVGVS
jgi:hypothetical protein